MTQKIGAIHQQCKYGINQRTSGPIPKIGASNRSKGSYAGQRRDGMNLQTDFIWLLVSNSRRKNNRLDKVQERSRSPHHHHHNRPRHNLLHPQHQDTTRNQSTPRHQKILLQVPRSSRPQKLPRAPMDPLSQTRHCQQNSISRDSGRHPAGSNVL